MTKMTKIFITNKCVEIEEQKQNVVKCYKLYVEVPNFWERSLRTLNFELLKI